MSRHAIDRWADTTLFRCALLFAGMVVLPVLAAGVVVSVVGGLGLLLERSAIDLAQGAFGLVSAGGALGFVGYVRAHRGARDPGRHNVTATLMFLAVGVMAALVVGGFALTGVFDAWTTPWSDRLWAAAPALFAAANFLWALSGIAWIQRLLSRYADKTGRAFDGLPVVLLFIALALATTAALTTSTL